jgi:TolB-like protein/DNA-binding winged helix-turn-helix (wHTH) protein/tetratricopeptide (TPR) repeat protein
MVRFGMFEVDIRTRQLTKNGMKIRLPHQSIQVLFLLLERSGEIVTREDLRRHLWPSDVFVDFDHGLNKSVQKLRDALGDSADSPRYIETIPRIGYRFIAPPHVALETPRLTPADGSPHEIVSVSDGAATVAPVRMPTGSRGRRTAVAVGIAATLIAGVAVAWMMQRTTRTSVRPIQYLAVLPLENLSGDASEQYLADGMTDELITSLGQIGALRVISQTTAMQYKGAHKSLPQIARELNVGAVVLGSVMRSGDRVRITAQLFDAETDKQLWAQSYEGDLSGVWGLQNQVASAVAEQIRIEITSSERTQLLGTPKVNPAAYEAFLKGNYFDKNTPESEPKALQYYQQAIKLDPHFARAYVGLARSYNAIGDWQDIPLGEANAAADAAVAKALELNPQLGEAYAERAWTLLKFRWDFPGAERDFRRGLELDSVTSSIPEGYGEYLVAMGRFDEGLQQMKRARDLDPLSVVMKADSCRLFGFARRNNDAAAQCNAALELDPGSPWAHRLLAEIYAQERRYPEAHKMMASLKQCDASCIAMLDEIHGAPGVHGAFDAWLKKQKEQPPAFFLSWACAGLGRKDQAFAWLEKAYETLSQQHDMIFVGVDPRFDPLRSDSRFDAFLRRAGLPPQPHTGSSQPDRSYKN